MTTTWLVLARAAQYGACLLLFGLFAFDRFVAAAVFTRGGGTTAERWPSAIRRLARLLLPIILLSGIAWFVLVAATMSGRPVAQALRLELLATVWNRTHFGAVWKLRSIVWLAASGAAVAFTLKRSARWDRAMTWTLLVLAAVLLSSLGWAGHSLDGPSWHLAADVAHLLVAGVWPAGLLPFALLMHRLRRSADRGRWRSMAALVRRFSAASLVSVTVLAATGLVNGCTLVGSWANLVGQVYGRWLLVKIVLFGAAVAIGAVNLLRLKPALLAADATPEEDAVLAARLQRNVYVELGLATAIVGVVAILGILPPAFPGR